ncbi:MAG: FAD-dependent oxidoreductase [Bacteroidota bacterium]
MSKKKDILIVGGGIVGLCCAYYLMESGHRVRIVDAGGLDAGCSYGNAGMLAASHVVPLAAPGMVATGLRMMWNPESPFYVRPRLSRRLWRWGRLFMKASSEKRMRAAMPVLNAVGQASRRAWDGLATQDGMACDFHGRGLLCLFQTEKGGSGERHHMHLAHELGVQASEWTAQQVAERNPGLDFNVNGAVFYPADAHLNPSAFMQQMYAQLKAVGLQTFPHTSISHIESNAHKITQIHAENQSFKADEIIIAAGAWSSELARKIGLRLPMMSGRGYSLTHPTPPQQLHIPSIFSEAKVAVTPLADTLRFAGTMEIVDPEAPLNPRRVIGIQKSIPRYFPAWSAVKWQNQTAWNGLRPCSPDGLPYIGRCKNLKNLYFATGHAMLGISLAPVTGQMIASLIDGKPSALQHDLLHPERYA